MLSLFRWLPFGIVLSLVSCDVRIVADVADAVIPVDAACVSFAEDLSTSDMQSLQDMSTAVLDAPCNMYPNVGFCNFKCNPRNRIMSYCSFEQTTSKLILKMSSQKVGNGFSSRLDRACECALELPSALGLNSPGLVVHSNLAVQVWHNFTLDYLQWSNDEYNIDQYSVRVVRDINNDGTTVFSQLGNLVSDENMSFLNAFKLSTPRGRSDNIVYLSFLLYPNINLMANMKQGRCPDSPCVNEARVVLRGLSLQYSKNGSTKPEDQVFLKYGLAQLAEKP